MASRSLHPARNELRVTAGPDSAISRYSFEHRTDQGFLAVSALAKKTGDDRTEEKPPEFKSEVEIVELQRFDHEIPGRRVGLLHASPLAEFLRSKYPIRDSPEFQHANLADLFGNRCARAPERKVDRPRTVPPSPQIKFADRRQCEPSAHNSQPRKGAAWWREVACGGDATRGRLQSTNAGKMSRCANRSPTVTADATHAAATGYGGGFATARTARRIGKIPGIRSFPS